MRRVHHGWLRVLEVHVTTRILGTAVRAAVPAAAALVSIPATPLAARLRAAGLLSEACFAVLAPAAYLGLSVVLGADVHWWFVAVLPLSAVAFWSLSEDPAHKRRN